MATWRLTLVKNRNLGFSIIEVITAVAILGIGIWAIVALFPKGQNIIRRSGLRQMATQLAHEAISDYLAEPAKLPYAIVPFNPNLIPNRPVLLEPAYLLDVRRTFNLVWGEPLDDGKPQGDPNKRVGLVQVGQNEWRSILKFAPPLPIPNWDTNGDRQPEIRVYREVHYLPVGIDRNGDGLVNGLDVADFEFFFDPQSSQVDVYLAHPSHSPLPRPLGFRLLRVSYELAKPIGPVSQINRELYIVSTARNVFTLNLPASQVLSIVEEFPLILNSDNTLRADEYELVSPGILRFSSSSPRPIVLAAADPRLGSLRADYIIDGFDQDNDGLIGEELPNNADDDGDGRVDEDVLGHWLIETSSTFSPDASLRQRMNLGAGIGVFQTTFGGLSPTAIQAIWVDPANNWGVPLTVSPTSDFQSGVLVFIAPNNQPLPPDAMVRVCYLTSDDWFSQVIKLPEDFQLVPPSGQNTNDVIQRFPYESLRWFEIIDTNRGVLRFSPILAGLSLQIRWLAPNGVKYEAVSSIGGDGSVQAPLQVARLVSVQNNSVLIRISGRTLWQQVPPQRKGDFVELISIVPTSQVSMP
ncbi:MAG: prepilin-type N-terminal cleavage/methylation domain-containing protein [Armatimonadetes bacterium]|nr:prepilin-type N-terminal cleavage/methylation domain-containing protein [Armatimonadota bacterium]MDW8028407.1 prepilin-type N-terminal cleavage/methylation domain-containing protein [Armatimonadota bacterium]